MLREQRRRLAGEFENLGPAYPWPGNVPELEQWVRNILLRGMYRPRSTLTTPTRARAVASRRLCSTGR